MGPRALRVYQALRQRILAGEWPSGSRLPSQTELAETFGVTRVTLREAMDALEAGRLIRTEHGVGTFVRGAVVPAVLIVDDDAVSRRLLGVHVGIAGLRTVEAAGPAQSLEAIERDQDIGLVLTDVRMPAAADGIEFIRTVRQRWPELPLAAVTAFPDDLDQLRGLPECPALILVKPINPGQVAEALRLVFWPRGTHNHDYPRGGSGGAQSV